MQAVDIAIKIAEADCHAPIQRIWNDVAADNSLPHSIAVRPNLGGHMDVANPVRLIGDDVYCAAKRVGTPKGFLVDRA